MSGTMDTTTRRWGRGLRTVGRLGAALHRGRYRTSGGKVGGSVRGVPVAHVGAAQVVGREFVHARLGRPFPEHPVDRLLGHATDH